jgi:hypothetical protein
MVKSGPHEKGSFLVRVVLNADFYPNRDRDPALHDLQEAAEARFS